MRRFIIAAAAALAISVSACAPGIAQMGTALQTLSTATVPQDAVIVARASFNTAQSVATNYLRLPRCTGSNGPLCRDPALTVRIGNAVESGRSARNRLTALMKASPGGSVPILDYNTLVAATAIINDLTAAYQAARGR